MRKLKKKEGIRNKTKTKQQVIKKIAAVPPMT